MISGGHTPAASPPTSLPSARQRRWLWQRYRLSLFGRSVALLVGELAVNLILWITAIALFAPEREKRGILSICVIAWTLGLRHALDMDHIVAIDNATRNLVTLNRLCVSTGTFFSLGHSTIVIAVTIAVVAATSTLDHLDRVSSVGGVIGVSVSASFLFVLAVINSISLWQTIRQQKRARQKREQQQHKHQEGQSVEEKASELDTAKEASELGAGQPKRRTELDSAGVLSSATCMGRIVRPVLKLIDKPWKMYVVGLLFGLGFDTSSEITLLGISALAHRDIPTADILILPLLFTAGMTLVDSCDSIFMLHCYALPMLYPNQHVTDLETAEAAPSRRRWWTGLRLFELVSEPGMALRGELDRDALPQWDSTRLTSITILLTVVSILMALLICIVEFMGLALEECASCSASLDYDPPTLATHWWSFWNEVNDNSGYLGAGVVAIFVVVFAVWGVLRKWDKRRATKGAATEGPRLDSLAQTSRHRYM